MPLLCDMWDMCPPPMWPMRMCPPPMCPSAHVAASAHVPSAAMATATMTAATGLDRLSRNQHASRNDCGQ